MLRGLGCPECGLGFVAGIVELGLEGLVDGSEGEDGGDAGQVEPVVKELADLAETSQVAVAVAAGTARAAGRGDQAAGLIEPQVLGGAADQFGGDGDPVHASVRVELVDRAVWEASFRNFLGHQLHGTWSLWYNKSIR